MKTYKRDIGHQIPSLLTLEVTRPGGTYLIFVFSVKVDVFAAQLRQLECVQVVEDGDTFGLVLDEQMGVLWTEDSSIS